MGNNVLFRPPTDPDRVLHERIKGRVFPYIPFFYTNWQDTCGSGKVYNPTGTIPYSMKEKTGPEINEQGGEESSRVRFTHLDKVLYPETGVTKKQLLEYYIRVAPKILPFLHDRPLTMHRFPDGVGGKDFFGKDAPKATPEYVEIFPHYSVTAGREVHFIVCNSIDTLLWLANIASLELHITLSTTGSYETPDFLLFDIDPEPPLTFNDVITVAQVVREHLVNEGMEPYVKTSGRKGLHIVVPLIPLLRFKETRSFTHLIGKAIARDTPHVVSEFPHSRDPGTIFIDYLQNAEGKTMVAPYSLRGSPKATVSTPLNWDELKPGLNPENFNITTIISRKEEPWREIFGNRQTIRG
jgi:bifunctional non-homologous end joining protein LigD